MKKNALVFTLLFLMACGGGGGETDPTSDLTPGGDDCDFDIYDLTNGASLSTIESYYACIDDSSEYFEFAFFDDGTGLDYSLENFSWDEIDCDEISIDSTGVDSVVKITDTENKVIEFTQKFDTGEEIDVACTLMTE